MTDDRNSVWRDPGKRCDTCHWYGPMARRCERLPEREPTTPGRVCRHWVSDAQMREQIERDAKPHPLAVDSAFLGGLLRKGR